MEIGSADIIKNTKALYDEGSVRLLELREHFFRLLPFWIAGSITALVATVYAKVFLICEDYSLMIYKNSGYWFLVISPLFFVISWYLVDRLSPFANGSGIPQLMAAVELNHNKKNSTIVNFLSFRIMLVKFLSSLAGVLGGGAIGREGPTLQIAGSIFYIIDQKWKLSDSRSRNGFILAGAASGLASAFNTPLGGIVYVVEELAKSHLSGFRTGVLHAVIFAGLISQLIMGPYLYFGFPKLMEFRYATIYKFIFLALLCALVTVMFSQALKKIVILRTQLNTFFKKFVAAALTGLIFAGFIVWLSPNAMGPGKNLLNDLLFNGTQASFMDMSSRFFGTLLTYSNGGAGGIFAPTLSLGGSAASYFANLFGFDLGALSILVGMTAALAALTHSPLTSFILILEMTDRYSSIFPLMIAALVGHGVSKAISKQSFYEFVCERLLKIIESK
jgi:H+/Cl- antiporter ClcA